MPVAPISQQLGFADLGPEPVATDRLFFAVFPDASAGARIARLAQGLLDEHGLKGRPLATERFHVTLHHIGDYAGLPQGVVDMALAAAAIVDTRPFEVAFDRTGTFVGRMRNLPVVLRGTGGVTALTELQRALGTAMMKTGLGRSVNRQYTPHVTLLYDDRSIEEQVVDTISWPVHEFVLVHSLLGKTRHVPLGRFTLPSAVESSFA